MAVYLDSDISAIYFKSFGDETYVYSDTTKSDFFNSITVDIITELGTLYSDVDLSELISTLTVTDVNTSDTIVDSASDGDDDNAFSQGYGGLSGSLGFVPTASVSATCYTPTATTITTTVSGTTDTDVDTVSSSSAYDGDDYTDTITTTGLDWATGTISFTKEVTGTDSDTVTIVRVNVSNAISTSASGVTVYITSESTTDNVTTVKYRATGLSGYVSGSTITVTLSTKYYVKYYYHFSTYTDYLTITTANTTDVVVVDSITIVDGVEVSNYYVEQDSSDSYTWYIYYTLKAQGLSGKTVSASIVYSTNVYTAQTSTQTINVKSITDKTDIASILESGYRYFAFYPVYGDSATFDTDYSNTGVSFQLSFRRKDGSGNVYSPTIDGSYNATSISLSTYSIVITDTSGNTYTHTYASLVNVTATREDQVEIDIILSSALSSDDISDYVTYNNLDNVETIGTNDGTAPVFVFVNAIQKVAVADIGAPTGYEISSESGITYVIYDTFGKVVATNTIDNETITSYSLAFYYKSASDDTYTQLTSTTTTLDTNGYYDIKVVVSVLNPNDSSVLETITGYGTYSIYTTSAGYLTVPQLDYEKTINESVSASDFGTPYMSYLISDDDYYNVALSFSQLSVSPSLPYATGETGDTTFTFSYNGYSTTRTITFVSVADDYAYAFNKKTFARYELGKIQQGFQIGLTLDGTKDTASITILNFDNESVEPNTIVYLQGTDTWWVVKKDETTRYEHESNAVWEHQISLVGLIELLNNRDLISCGFNMGHYTIAESITRLFQMSDFEWKDTLQVAYGNVLDSSKTVPYLKTYENYTPLSALTEFLNGYNAVAKMTFQTTTSGSDTYLDYPVITLLSKSGNATIIDNDSTDYFNDSREKLHIDRENYGGRVISNAQNVVSTNSIKFPAIGSARIGTTTYKLEYETPGNAVLRLPSNAYKVNSLTIWGKVYCKVTYGTSGLTAVELSTFNADNKEKLADFITSVVNSLDSSYGDYIESDLDEIVANAQDACSIYLENGGEYNYITKTWNSKAVKMATHDAKTNETTPSIILNTKKYYDSFDKQWKCVYWEQGTNIINNLGVMFDYLTGTLLDGAKKYDSTYTYTTTIDGTTLTIYILGYFNIFGKYESTYTVNYIPMSDMKLKVDNDLDNIDTNIFNQTGKMIDSYALSKLVTSHAQLVGSNEITKYKTYYSFADIPTLGTIVIDNDTKYIINHISYDLAQSENEYFIECEFTLTKNIACKSAMISANTNIRDYDCPQENNIYRKQVYRDVIYLTYDSVENNESYVDLSKIFNVGGVFSYGNSDTLIAMIKATSTNFTSSSDNSYYFQLPTSKIYLDKMYVEIVDFLDNNIIGYSNQTTTHPFDIQTWLTAKDLISLPVSYVDDYGELDSLELTFVNESGLVSAYDTYIATLDNEEQTNANQIDVYSWSCIIPSGVYDEAYEDNEFIISESAYDKDGLEIPMFEHIVQVVDNGNFVFGSDFLKSYDFLSTASASGLTYTKRFIFYTWFTSSVPITSDNATSLDNSSVTRDITNSVPYITLTQNANVSYSDNVLTITPLGTCVYNAQSNAYTSTTSNSFATSGLNIGVIKHVVTLVYFNAIFTQQAYIADNKSLFVAINNCENEFQTDSDTQLTIPLYVNCKKLK